MQLVEDLRLDHSGLSDSTSVIQKVFISHIFSLGIKVALVLGLHKGVKVGVDFHSGSESVTETKVILILSVLLKENVIHLLLELIGVSLGVVLFVLSFDFLNLLMNFTSGDISESLLHVPVVVLTLESISAGLGHSSELSKLCSISGYKLRSFLA